MSLPRRRVLAALAAAACCGLLAACGTPAAVKPTATPLPGFKRDIQEAQGAVAQSQQQAAALGATTVSP